MRQFISTKYLGPTNHRGSRVKAVASGSAPDHRMAATVEWDHALNSNDNHRHAASVLARQLGWAGEWIAGGGQDGNVYVMNDHEPRDGFTITRVEG